MTRNELMQAVQAYVLGLCYLYNVDTKTFSTFAICRNTSMRNVDCAYWVTRVQDICWKHLNNELRLGGGLHDFECKAAALTKQAFEKQLAAVE